MPMRCIIKIIKCVDCFGTSDLYWKEEQNDKTRPTYCNWLAILWCNHVNLSCTEELFLCALRFKNTMDRFCPLPLMTAESIKLKKKKLHHNSGCEDKSNPYPHNSPGWCQSTRSTGRWWRTGGWAKSQRRRWERWRGSWRCGAAPSASCRSVGACRSRTETQFNTLVDILLFLRL